MRPKGSAVWKELWWAMNILASVCCWCRQWPDSGLAVSFLTQQTIPKITLRLIAALRVLAVSSPVLLFVLWAAILCPVVWMSGWWRTAQWKWFRIDAGQPGAICLCVTDTEWSLADCVSEHLGVAKGWELLFCFRSGICWTWLCAFCKCLIEVYQLVEKKICCCLGFAVCCVFCWISRRCLIASACWGLSFNPVFTMWRKHSINLF